jgi:hypothetical protein
MYGWRLEVILKPIAVVAVVAMLGGFPGLHRSTLAGEPPREQGGYDFPPSLVSLPRRAETPEERRLDFEREYGIQQRNPSKFLSMLQSAKYGLDELSFTAKETANQLQFTYDFGTPTGPDGMTRKPQYSVPVFGAFGHPQLKTVLTEHDPQTGTPFVGLKLSIPFGGTD